MICTLLRKPLTGGGILQNLPGAIMNIDACRVPSNDTLAKMSGVGILAGVSEGWDRPWKTNPDALARRQAAADEAIEKANTLGRWGANVVLTALTSSCMDSQYEKANRFFKQVSSC